MKTYRSFISEARRRIAFTRIYHGTPSSSAKSIEKSGFNTSEVHASTSRDIARSFGSRHGENTRVIAMRVPSKSIKSEYPAKALKTQGQRGVDDWGREHFSVIMSPDYATKNIKKDSFIHAPKTKKQWQDRLPKKFRRKKAPIFKTKKGAS